MNAHTEYLDNNKFRTRWRGLNAMRRAAQRITRRSNHDCAEPVARSAGGSNWLVSLLSEQHTPSEAQIRRLHRQVIDHERAQIRAQKIG